MPTSVSAAKRQRQNEKHRIENRRVRSTLRTEVRRFLEAVESNNKEEAAAVYLKVSGLLDRAAGKNVVHKNYAARKKSRLKKKLNKMDA